MNGWMAGVTVKGPLEMDMIWIWFNLPWYLGERGLPLTARLSLWSL